MVVFSYGIPRSGSTLAFQMARCLLMLRGHSQALLPPPFTPPGHRVNFAQELDPAVLRALVARVGAGKLVVKTHACPGPEWVAEYKALAQQGLVCAHVNHRDPRDICLSLVDVGALARSRGDAAFAEFVTLEDAVARVRGYLAEIAVWQALPATLPLRYETCAFRMDAAIDAMKAQLGIACPNWPVRLYLRRIAFTWRNKAVPARHRAELDPARIAWMDSQFAPYLAQMGYAPAPSAMAM